MPLVFLGASILGSTLMWPLNRWLTHRGGSAQLYGFWIGASGVVLSGALSLAAGQSLGDPQTWLVGGIVGLAFSFGYCYALMKCVQTGPIGPSAAVNNMGLLWPVLLGAAWLDPHPLGPLQWSGLAMTVTALVLFGFGGAGGDAPKGTSPRVSVQWGYWAMLTWISAGISMSAQLYASLHIPGQQFAVIFAFMSVTTVIYLPVVARQGRAMFARTELLAGSGNGLLQVGAISAMFLALRSLKAELVFPFSIGAPVILALLLGAVVYRDRIGGRGVSASVLGVAGLILLSLA